MLWFMAKKKPAPVPVHGAIPSLEPLLVPIGSVKLDPANARLHPERNLSAIQASLTRFGQQKPIVVDKNGVVLAGNGTLEAAVAMGWTHVAAVRTKLAGLEARAYAIADNKTGELAEWDWERLSSQLRDLKAEFPDISLDFTGFADFEIEPLLQAVWSPPAQSDAVIAGNGGLTVKFDPEQAKIVNDAVDRLRASKGDMPITEALVILCRMLNSKKPAPVAA